MTKEAPTETQASDAGPAVNTPAEFKRLWDERMRLVKQRAEKLAELDAEIEQADRELNQDPAPPGLTAAAKISSAIREFTEAWRQHTEHVEQNIETPFKQAWTPTQEVFDAILIVSMELGDVLEGIRAPDALLRAADAIVDDGDRRTQARQCRAIDRCAETLEVMRALRGFVEKGRLDAEADRERQAFYARALVHALAGIEPGFSSIVPSTKELDDEKLVTLLKIFGNHRRRNASPAQLLFDLMTLADVWPKTKTVDALKKAHATKK